ncbi:hypothetical protein [Amaricoccus sp.]|uniref:hypothetical protein n=1 Tax=Amaricoccus sp. TaxID=1872485 RepID=UPI001B6672E4|nr:hypothetical protein [Amaricoccus sp.]MBP7000530.1 hypothetical protein [Amaricoccus sp.]
MHFLDPRPLPTFVCLIALAGCGGTPTPRAGGAPPGTAMIGLEYASTSLGFRNSGDLAPGRLYLWDLAGGDLVDIEAGIPLKVLSSSPPADRVASQVEGFTLAAGADVAGQARGEVRAAVSRDLRLDVTQASRDENADPRGAISAVYRARQAAGEDAFTGWRVRDATGNPDRYRYVLLVDPVRAASESVRFASQSGGSAGVGVVDTVVGSVEVSVPAETAASCRQSTGERPICFLNARVLRPFLNAANNLDYEPVAYSKEALSGAFRKP